ncbi:MAG: LPS assembly lipoprotein LptE [Chromatiales bacterium]|nr:LPS assembly lipoprotein LptE [Chromatiales bacterium]
MRYNPVPLALLIITLLLSGCGFQLRGASDLPASISPVHIQGVAPNSPIGRELRQLLLDSQVAVSADFKQAASVLRLSDYRSHRRVLSVDNNGKVAEYELHESVRFELIEKQSGKQRLTPQAIGVTRAYINTEEEVLGKQQEEAFLRQDMQRDLAYRLIRRLQAQLK